LRLNVTFAATASAIMLLAGCASAYGYSYGGYGYNVAADYSNPLSYDDFYGPFTDGYWGPEGNFWFRGARERELHRDFGHHFRRAAVAGFHPVMRVHQAMARRAAMMPQHGVHLQS
jgi:hypothetical protein